MYEAAVFDVRIEKQLLLQVAMSKQAGVSELKCAQRARFLA